MTIKKLAQLVHAIKTITGKVPDPVVTAKALAVLEPKRKRKK